MTLQLRPYQVECIQSVDQHFRTVSPTAPKGGRSGIIHLPTGTGKTAVTVGTVDTLFNPHQGYRTMIACGVNRTLVEQMRDSFHRFLPYTRGTTVWNKKQVPVIGIEMASKTAKNARIVAASMQTLMSGMEDMRAAVSPIEAEPITKDDILVKDRNVFLHPKSKRRYLVSPRVDVLLNNGGVFHLWVHDEAHHAPADGSALIIARLREINDSLGEEPLRIIGNTATPARADDRALTDIFERILFSRSIAWAQEEGFLVPFATPRRILVDAVDVTPEGDDSGDAEQTVARFVDNWAEAITEGWQRIGENRPTIAFVGKHNGVSAISDSKHLAQTMRNAGIKAAHVDGTGCIDENGKERPKEYQEKILKGLQSGKIQVVCNYNVLVEGVDIPKASCVILARRFSADNPVAVTQILGRILRPAEGKTDALVIATTEDPITLRNLSVLTGTKVVPGGFKPPSEVLKLCIRFMDYLSSGESIIRQWELDDTNTFTPKQIAQAFALAAQAVKNEEVPDTFLKVHEEVLLSVISFFNNEEQLMEGSVARRLSAMKNRRAIEIRDELMDIQMESALHWMLNTETGVMTLGVNKQLAFGLYPPNGDAARLCRLVLDALPNVPTNIMKESDRNTTIRSFETVLTFWENFTLWAVDITLAYKPQILPQYGNMWTLAEPAANNVDEKMSEIITQLTNGETRTYSKKSGVKWKKDIASQEQIGMLNKLYNPLPIGIQNAMNSPGGLSKGLAHQFITQAVVMKATEPRIRAWYNVLHAAVKRFGIEDSESFP